MLKYFIALFALTFTIQASALDATASNEPPKSPLIVVPNEPLAPPTSGGGGGGDIGPGSGIVYRPKPIDTLPPVPADPPIAKVPDHPLPPIQPVEPPIVKIPELPPSRPIEPPFQSSCGFIKNRLNVRSNTVNALQPLMSLRNMDYEMLRNAQNRIYDLSISASRAQDASLKTSLQNEITCFREVADTAQANVNADMQAIAKLLNSPITEPVRPTANLPLQQSDTRSPAGTAPASTSHSIQQVRVAN